MNRRSFFARLAIAPFAAKAIVAAATAEPEPKLHWRTTCSRARFDFICDRKTAERIHKVFAEYHATKYGVGA